MKVISPTLDSSILTFNQKVVLITKHYNNQNLGILSRPAKLRLFPKTSSATFLKSFVFGILSNETFLSIHGYFYKQIFIEMYFIRKLQQYLQKRTTILQHFSNILSMDIRKAVNVDPHSKKTKKKGRKYLYSLFTVFVSSG